ncbi:MAG: hypothetical protein ACP6IS_11175 [Candidatus Asgardarchaeia archaeon]
MIKKIFDEGKFENVSIEVNPKKGDILIKVGNTDDFEKLASRLITRPLKIWVGKEDKIPDPVEYGIDDLYIVKLSELLQNVPNKEIADWLKKQFKIQTKNY